MEFSGKTKVKMLLIGLTSLIFLGTIGNIYACDGGNNWKLIFRHDISSGVIFLNDEEAKKFNENIVDPTSVAKYSRLYQLENYRSPHDGKFELKLVYPNNHITNHWKQTSNPVTKATRGVDGYEAIFIGSTAGSRGGLEHELGTTTFLDGVPNSSTWRWAIGSHTTYGNNVSIPGPGQLTSLVELYVCGDDIDPIGTIIYTTETATNGNVIATISLNESGSITNNNGSNQYVFTENGSFVFEFVDNAWNTNSATATVNRIDKSVPTANMAYSFRLPTSGTVMATLTGLSENITITNNNGSNQYVFTENGVFVFEFVDNAGNTNSATATVNNIYPEYITELSYNNPLLINPSEIQNYIRTFSDGGNPDRHCIYKTLKLDLGYNETYAIIPAWTCYTIDGGTTNDLNLYNTIIQKTNNERYKFLFGKATIKTYFDKPIKFVFNKNMFSGIVVGLLDLEPNLFLKHIGDVEYMSDSISHSYYANCINGLSDISNSQLIYYNESYIGYTCEGGDFKVGFDITGGSNSGGNNNGSNGRSNTSGNTGGNIVYNTYNTYNTYNNSSSTKKYNDGTDGDIATNIDSNNNYYDTDNNIEITDDLIKKDISTIVEEVKAIALDKGIAINQDLLDIYIFGRKNYIITHKYYNEDYLLKDIDYKTLAIILSRYATQVLMLSEIKTDTECKFDDIYDLDSSIQNYITLACKYGIISSDDEKFYPDKIVKRNNFANNMLKLINIQYGSDYNNIEILKEKGIINILDDRKENRQTILTIMKRIETDNKNSSIGAVNESNYTFTKPYKLGYKGIGVRKLQEFLINYGTLEGKITGYFGKKTLEALYQFQLREGILTGEPPIHLRGYMGPGTRDAINQMIK